MGHGRDVAPKRFGMVASFASPDDLLAAAKAAKAEGYSRIDGYSPIPIHGLVEQTDFNMKKEDLKLSGAIFGAGLTGALAGLGLQTWVSVLAYQHNVGGKPDFSWPAFIPVTFECTILLAGLTSAGAMIALNGLPKPHHPLFNAECMQRASQDRFVLCIEAGDPNFEPGKVEDFLHTLNPETVEDVWTSDGY